MKLFTIGDSISQGFMSAAAARSELAYSTILAETLGIAGYRKQVWTRKHHLKFDFEMVMRRLEEKFGSNIRGLEWLGVMEVVNDVVDPAEDFFERKGGALGKPVEGKPGWYHNVAVEGMDVGDAWMVTPKLCEKVVKATKKGRRDGYLQPANVPFYRNAYRTLNPDAVPDYMDYSALDWLKHHAEDEGIENTILWLGANNALGTVISLDIKQTSGDGSVLEAAREERQKWNLWHPDDFELEYRSLLERVSAAMGVNRAQDWHVFIGNVPYVTIAPVAKGIGGERPVGGSGHETDGLKGLYYQYYTYFPFTEELALSSGKYLKYSDALHIDRSILAFNRSIARLIDAENARLDSPRYHLVDTCKALRDMAWKRNFGEPTYEWPSYFDHAYPPLNTKYYHASRSGRIEKGGIFSLDGIHPTAVGQGLIAWEFLKKMQDVGAVPADAQIDWRRIDESDSLRQRPIKLMQEIYDHERFLQLVVDIINLFRD